MHPDDMMTKAERDRILAMRQEKWAKFQQHAHPYQLEALKKFSGVTIYEEDFYDVQTGVLSTITKTIDGRGTRVTFFRIGNEVLIGQANNRHPE